MLFEFVLNLFGSFESQMAVEGAIWCGNELFLWFSSFHLKFRWKIGVKNSINSPTLSSACKASIKAIKPENFPRNNSKWLLNWVQSPMNSKNFLKNFIRSKKIANPRSKFLISNRNNEKSQKEKKILMWPVKIPISISQKKSSHNLHTKP